MTPFFTSFFRYKTVYYGTVKVLHYIYTLCDYAFTTIGLEELFDPSCLHKYSISSLVTNTPLTERHRVLGMTIYQPPPGVVFTNIPNLSLILVIKFMTFVLVKIDPNLVFTKHVLARTIFLILSLSKVANLVRVCITHYNHLDFIMWCKHSRLLYVSQWMN